MSSLSLIDKNNVPVHIAVIMDGNGRWATTQGKARILGHQSALQAVRNVIEGAKEAGVKYLTLYAFSSENWNRPKDEIEALINIIVLSLQIEMESLMKNNVKLITIGNMQSMPLECREEFQIACDETKNNTGLNLIIALNYGSRWEITKAVKQIASDVVSCHLTVEDITENRFCSYLTTS